jgi:ABC-type Zn uptake system ZnuABC Zn-binding protein ZnuA
MDRRLWAGNRGGLRVVVREREEGTSETTVEAAGHTTSVRAKGTADGIGRVVILALAVLFVPILTACGGEAEGPKDGPVRVVATYSILGDLVHNVGGEKVELTTLVGPNGDAHTFEPAPSDNAELAEAEVVFENGLGFEPWLGDLYAASGSEAARVTVTDPIEPLTVAARGQGHEEDAHEEDAHEDGEYGQVDPHAWHDVNNTIAMVKSIRDALSEADPGNARSYRRSAEGCIADLEALDAEVWEKVGSIPEENRVLFTSHDTFGYFADRYGFEVDTALASASTEAGDPSAGQTAEVVEKVEGSGVPAIFADNVSDAGVMEGIAAEAGVELAPPLYTDALGEPGSEGGTYAGMVRYNVSTMSEALQR